MRAASWGAWNPKEFSELTVADGGVAMHATRRLPSGRVVTQDVVDQIVMTMNAVLLQDFQTYGSKADRFGEILQREAFRVPEAILGLDQVLWDHLVRDMAV